MHSAVLGEHKKYSMKYGFERRTHNLWLICEICSTIFRNFTKVPGNLSLSRGHWHKENVLRNEWSLWEQESMQKVTFKFVQHWKYCVLEIKLCPNSKYAGSGVWLIQNIENGNFKFLEFGLKRPKPSVYFWTRDFTSSETFSKKNLAQQKRNFHAVFSWNEIKQILERSGRLKHSK